MRKVANERAKELCKTAYKPGAGDNFVAIRKAWMTLPVSNRQYIWGDGWKDAQTVNIDESVYVIEKPRLVRQQQLVGVSLNKHKVWERLFITI